MPIKEACHVAVQRSSPGKQRMWKHIRARHLAKGSGARPMVSIVSFLCLFTNFYEVDVNLGCNIKVTFLCLIILLHTCLQVSFGSDRVNRAPTFDMDLSDFYDSYGEPISYEAAYKYFDQDASQK
jgi:L-arabinokinase